MAVISQDQLSSYARLSRLVRALTTGEAVSVDQDPPWWEEGIIVEVTEADCYDYLVRRPPRYMNGSCFAFDDESGPLTLFWQSGPTYFARHLSQAETEHFCRLGSVELQV